MGHGHSLEKRRYALSARIAFLAGIVLLVAALFIMTAAGVGDAIHLITDGFVSLISWEIARRAERDHGNEAVVRHRGAFAQAGLLALAGAVIATETYFYEHEPRSALQMMALGGISTVIAAWRFSVVHPEWRRSVTGKGEVWHVVIDFGTSLTVAVAGFLLWRFAIPTIDRYAGYAIALLALLGAVHLLFEVYKEAKQTSRERRH